MADYYEGAMFGPEGMIAIDDNGAEKLVPPVQFWEWESDAVDTITPESWEAQQGDIYGTSN